MRVVAKVAVAAVLLGAVAGTGLLVRARLAGDEPRAGEGDEPARVVLAEARQARVARTVEAVGTLIATESVGLTAEVEARVEAIGFRQGEPVEAGAVLVRLEADEAEAELRALRAEAEEIAQALERAETLLDSGAGRRAAVEDQRAQAAAARARADAAQARLEDHVIRAPFAGRVGLREVSVGALVAPGRELVTLDVVSPIDLRFTLPERYLAEVAAGSRVVAISVAYPDRRFEGEVTAVDSRVDPALRGFELEARLPNGDGALRPGMFMGVEVTAGVREDAVVVPPLALQVRGQTHFVFRVEGDKARRVEVRIGQRTPDRVEITDGLRPGDRVVVEGLQRVADGRPVVVERPEEGRPPPEGGGAAPGPAAPQQQPAS